jgi:hypothetical protein
MRSVSIGITFESLQDVAHAGTGPRAALSSYQVESLRFISPFVHYLGYPIERRLAVRPFPVARDQAQLVQLQMD